VSLCPLQIFTVCPLFVSNSHCTQHLVLCHYVHCCFLKCVCCLPVPHTVHSVGSVSLCPLLSSTVCPLSVSTSHSTFGWFCVTMPPAVFYSLSTVCQYLTQYIRLVLCHYAPCCLLQSVHCLSVPHTVPSVGSVSLCPLLSSTLCPLSVSTSHCTVCWLCVSTSTAVFYSLSTVCQYLTLYRLLALCQYFHCCLLQSVHCLSLSHTVPCFGFLSLCPLMFLQSVHCLSVPHTVTYFGFLSLCPLLFLQSVHCLSVPHTVPFLGSVSLCPVGFSTVCQLSVSTSHCNDCWFCVTISSAFFYSLSIVCKYLTQYLLLVLCHYVLCIFLQSVHCL